MLTEVPAYNKTELQSQSSDFAACVFVLNEGERVRAQLTKMAAYANLVDIVVADGGSNDGSLDIPFLTGQGVNTLLTKTGAGQLSAQMRMAIEFCLQRGYKGIVVVDGNNKDDVSALPNFVRALEHGFDHVQGSRYIAGGKALNTPFSRHWGVKILHAPLISLSAGYRYTDTTNGFRAYSRTLLTDERVQPLRNVFQKYELHYYLAIRAARLGFRICEVPVTRAYPKVGKTPTKISPFSGNLLILKTLFKAVTGGYNPHRKVV